MGAGSGGARRISINTGRLHVQIDVLDATPVGTRLAKHRTEQVQRALPFRLQVQSGDNGLLIARRGLVRDLEDMLDLIDLRVLPFRTSVGGDAFALPSRNMPLRCVLPQRSARVGGVRARALLLLLRLAALFDVFGLEGVEG